jgi:hypothetical protein
MSEQSKPKKAKVSSVRHTRAVALDRSKHQPAAPPPQEVEQILNQIIQPATFSLLKLYQEMGLRTRILTLPVMLAFVLSLIWRQIGSVREAVRVLNEDGLLWLPPLKISQQALSTRLREMPAGVTQFVKTGR